MSMAVDDAAVADGRWWARRARVRQVPVVVWVAVEMR